jgi:adenosylhomocysteine nucleosidase
MTLMVSAAHARRPALCETGQTDHAAAPYLAVVSAYPAELAPIAAATDVDGTIEIGERPFYTGRLAGVRVLLGLTGIGVVNAANVIQTLLERHDIAGLVMSGTGGTRHHIGDVVVASEMTEPGRTHAYQPNAAHMALARRAATALPEPLERCTLVPPNSPTAEEVCLLFDPVVIFGGHLMSVDPFNGNAVSCAPGGDDVFGCELPPAGMLLSRSITTDDVEDNESAAVARIASRRHVPFLAIRAGSDGGGDPFGDRGFPAQFFDYYRLAAHNAADVTRAIVAALGRLASDDDARKTCRLLARRRWKAAAARLDQE